MNKKAICFTHGDLDGAASYLTVQWFYPDMDIDVKAMTPQNFRNKFTSWLVDHKLEDYDIVFITDLDISEHKDLIDKKNVMIIDHHTSHARDADYEYATAIVKEYPSAAKLIYNTFSKKSNVNLTDRQKTLIALANDYDSYTLSIPDSYNLNIIYWNTSKRFASFIKNYKDGFYSFSDKQKNIIKLYNQKLSIVLNRMSVFKNDISLSGVKYKFVGAVVNETSFKNEIADILLKKYGADVAFVIDTISQHVSFRKNKNVDNVDCSKIAKKLCDGGGHAYAAGGKITSNLMDFAKTFTPISTQQNVNQERT